jgi:hypothetical protein
MMEAVCTSETYVYFNELHSAIFQKAFGPLGVSSFYEEHLFCTKYGRKIMYLGMHGLVTSGLEEKSFASAGIEPRLSSL